MEKQQQQYVLWGIGAVVVVAVLWFAYGNSQKQISVGGNVNAPVIANPRPAAAGLAGEIVAGALVPTTGELAALGKTLQNAIALATEDINAERGVVGKKLVFVTMDSTCGGDQTQSLVVEKQVQAIIGVVGETCANEKDDFLSVVNANPLIALASTDVSDALANASESIFRFAPPAKSAGMAAAAVAVDTMKAKHATALIGNTSFGKEVAAAFQNSVLEKGGETANTVVVGLSTEDEIGSINTAADVVYLVPADGSQLVRFVQFARERAPTAAILVGGTALNPSLLAEHTSLFEGGTFLAPLYDRESERMQQFLAHYKSRYGEEPAYPFYAANAYSQTYLLRDLIEKDGYDAAKMQKTLRAPLTGWSGGAYGKVDLNKMGDTTARAFAVWKVEAGSLVAKGTIQE
jgi:branched-chain amino acid transport system substrate-binding protein